MTGGGTANILFPPGDLVPDEFGTILGNTSVDRV